MTEPETSFPAIVEREDLPFAGYVVYHIWVVDDQGRKVVLQGQMTIHTTDGQPDQASLADVQARIGDLAARNRLSILTVPW